MTHSKRPWHIQTRILVALITMTTVILLAVVVVFNVFIRNYLRGRIADQLDGMVASVEERQARAFSSEDFPHPTDSRDDFSSMPPGDFRFDDHEDRTIGTRGDAVILHSDGTLVAVLNGEDEIGEEVAGYYQSGHALSADIRKEMISLSSGSYAVSVVSDTLHPEDYIVFYVDVTSINAYTAQVNLLLFIIIFIAMIFSVFLSRRLARYFAWPVERLSRFAEEIGSGNLEPQELTFHEVEFDQLAGSMNKMAMDLKAANQKQETFFQNVSHELRTPLTSIRGNAEGILYGVMEPREAGQVILSETERLSGFVEDILYMSRMGRSNPDGEYPPIDLRELLSLCVSEQHTQADARSLIFDFDFDEEPVEFPMREQDAQQLFGNLLSNAIRYASAVIKLSCHRQDGYLTVVVSDDGPGIPEAERSKIFERFYKGQGGQHGIGLSIVQTVVDAYHGSIQVSGSHGATFTVRFPV